ncbi:MAG TPA: hypothetical protein VN948_14835 [Terriglobales bacterium]|nr:hypothetical protein [Terriglobales bacterium]
MAIRVATAQPSSLLTAIKKAIDERKVETWSYDSDGDFTHTPTQWTRKAWLRPTVQSGALVLNILNPRGTNLSREIYGVYHGRFIEMLLAHFDDRFADAHATAAVTVGDSVSA